MRNFIILLSLFIVGITSAQTKQQFYLWPIDGAQTGSNMICVPQGHLEGELNFGNIFIGAPEGTRVLSPVDGTIENISIGYLSSLVRSTGWGMKETNFDDNLKRLRDDVDAMFIPKYLNGSLGIKSKDGFKIWISGLNGKESFKTGQAIKKGEPIGLVAYSYHKIKEPSISVSVDKAGKPSDPMKPFGIKSTFVPPAAAKPIVSLSKAKVLEDFTIYMDVLKEAYPGLYDVVGRDELEQYIKQTTATINARQTDLPFDMASDIIMGAVAKVHDSHIYINYLPEKRANKLAKIKAISFGFIADTLICTNAVMAHKSLIGQSIKNVNGITADSIRKAVLSKSVSYDAKVESLNDYRLNFADYFSNIDFGSDLKVEFSSGKTIKLLGVNKGTQYIHPLAYFGNNLHKGGYDTRILNDSTAYLGLSHFSFTQVQLENIGHFIDSISGKTAHLIIDVRNNGGGVSETIDKLYSYIAGETFCLNSFSKVNRRDGYPCFKYSMNRTTDDNVGFSDYVEQAGKEGYYSFPEKPIVIEADTAINYKGKVYVLANEHSISAATLFPAMLVRNHRGVVVGRETRTAYHFMNAYKFADIRLPNSTIGITVPLVQCVFDTVVNNRVPYGRGVIPDYACPTSLDEIYNKNGDAIINYTLQLIANGEYLKTEDPFKHANGK